MPIHASRRFAPRSPGRTICSTNPSVSCSQRSPSSRAERRSTRSRQCATPTWTCSPPCSTRASCGEPVNAYGCSRRSANSPPRQLAADPTADELGDRHADYYLALAESWDRELRGPGQAAAARAVRVRARKPPRSPRAHARSRFADCPSAGSGALGVLVHARSLPGGPRAAGRRARAGFRGGDGGQGVRPRGGGTARLGAGRQTGSRWACSRKGWRARAPSARPGIEANALSAAIRLPRARQGGADPPRRGGDRAGPRFG